MDEILKLTQEKSTWLFLAEGLTQEHQQSVKLDILRKVDNLQSQINELKRAKANSFDDLGDCNMPRVTKRYFVCEKCGHKATMKNGIPSWTPRTEAHSVPNTGWRKLCREKFTEVTEEEYNAL